MVIRHWHGYQASVPGTGTQGTTAFTGTEVCRLIEGAKAEVYTVVIILAIVLVYTGSHNTMAYNY
jgi:hypothetical protein